MAKVIGCKEGHLIYDSVPKGWRVLTGAVNRLSGYRWICKNVSRYGEDHNHALVPEDVAIEWWKENT